MKSKDRTEEILNSILVELELVRKQVNPSIAYSHYVDYDVSKWDDPLDGLDYSIMIISKKIEELK